MSPVRIDPAVRYSVVDPTVAVVEGALVLVWPTRTSRRLSAPDHSSFRQTARRAGAPTNVTKRLRASARTQPDALLAVAPAVLARSPLTADARAVLEAERRVGDDDLAGAVDILTGVEVPSTLLVLAAVSLWSRLDCDRTIVEAVSEVGNVDDSTALLMIEQANALARLGEESAALRRWSNVLAVARTPAVIKRRAILARAQFHHRHGRVRRAVQDLSRLDGDVKGMTTTLRSLRRTLR